jgi:methyl-accepting chemotaxis protein
MRFQFHTIKAKLITSSVLLLSIAMLILGFISYSKSAQSLDELGKTSLKNSVEMVIDQIETLNREVEKGNISLEEAQEQVKTSILGEKNPDGTRPINKGITLGENGYLFILDQEGNRVAHPTLEGSNAFEAKKQVDIDNAKKLLAAGAKGGDFVYYETNLPNNKEQIERKVNFSKNDPYWGWTITAGTFMMDFNQPANEILKIILIVGAITALIGVFIIWSFANGISKPIKEVNARMIALAEGDLISEPIQIKTKDETGKLADALNQMQYNLKEIIQKVADSSESISGHSEKLTQSANEVKAGSEQIASTMQELASGSEKQASQSSQLSASMGSFVNSIQKTSENGEQIKFFSQQVQDLTNEGSQLMDSSNEQMAKIDDIFKDSVQKVQSLDKQSQEISKLVIVIKGIADQTNLLALNAAIEAARAGEHGKGFAVVADEVRKLAEQVAFSVKDISKIVSNIQTEINTVTLDLQNGYQEVETGTDRIRITGQTFKNISHSIDDVVRNIQLVSSNLENIVRQSQEMNGSIQEIAAISEEAAAGVEQTSAATQQSSSSMEEVANSSSQLALLAEQLRELISHFKIQKQ